MEGHIVLGSEHRNAGTLWYGLDWFVTFFPSLFLFYLFLSLLFSLSLFYPSLSLFLFLLISLPLFSSIMVSSSLFFPFCYPYLFISLCFSFFALFTSFPNHDISNFIFFLPSFFLSRFPLASFLSFCFLFSLYF